MKLTIGDPFVRNLVDDMGALIGGATHLRDSIFDRLCDLARAQCDIVARYWGNGPLPRGVPTSAFRGQSLCHFPECEPRLRFRTSGTTGRTRGEVSYSPPGAALLDLAIRKQARERLANGRSGRCFACIRVVPSPAAVPDVVMAYGMAIIADELGFRSLSDTAYKGLELDIERLDQLLDQAEAESVPVLLMGGTVPILKACEALASLGRNYQLPEGSIVLDAGGFKKLAPTMTVADAAHAVERCLGSVRAVNLFGMTELASQLYDVHFSPVGPRGERAKGGCAWAWPTVRDPYELLPVEAGVGLLEITDLAILDRPCVIQSDDLALAVPRGAAVIGRAVGSPTRGCALHIEELTGHHG